MFLGRGKVSEVMTSQGTRESGTYYKILLILHFVVDQLCAELNLEVGEIVHCCKPLEAVNIDLK